MGAADGFTPELAVQMALPHGSDSTASVSSSAAAPSK